MISNDIRRYSHQKIKKFIWPQTDTDGMKTQNMKFQKSPMKTKKLNQIKPLMIYDTGFTIYERHDAGDGCAEFARFGAGDSAVAGRVANPRSGGGRKIQ